MVGVVVFFVGVFWYKWVVIVEIVFGIVLVLKKVYVFIKICIVDINMFMFIVIVGMLVIVEWFEGVVVVYVFFFFEVLQEFCMYKVQWIILGFMFKVF